ncbi:MAG: DUF58 domain-containing protein [Halobacteriales archaeon]
MSVVAAPAGIEHADGAREVRTRPPAATASTEHLVEQSASPTHRWYGIGAISLGLAGLAVLTTAPSLLLAAAVGVWYTLYARIGQAPTPTLELERTVEDPSALPGERVRVTLRVENLGRRPVTDLRIVDGVPEALAVVEGSPRHATALAPGSAASFAYEVETRQGRHAFDPATLVVRDVAGAHERVFEADVDSAIHVSPDPDPLAPMALRQLTRSVTGRVETDASGPGVEFHSTREYRPGDPRTRIDWHRTARTGELTTIEFRRELAATVVVIVDLRREAFVSPPGGDRSITTTSLEASAALFFSLHDVGDQVGLATLGPEPVWLSPGLGVDHRATAQLLFAGHPALGATRPEVPVAVNRSRWSLNRRLPAAAQVVFVSPLVDAGSERFAAGLEARGHLVTVVSPDPTGHATAGQLLGALERNLRVRRLRDRGVRVVDWHPDDSLAMALEEASLRW